MGQLVYPFLFRLIQSFLQPIKDHLVGGLGLPVPLWVCRGRVVVPDFEFTTISLESLTVELCYIVRYEIICPNEQPPLVRNSSREWSHDV